MIQIPEQDLRNIFDCLESGLESTEELLIQHDVNFGRTTKKNKMLANILESEIERTKTVIKQLKLQLP
jgi:Ribonuclease G/E